MLSVGLGTNGADVGCWVLSVGRIAIGGFYKLALSDCEAIFEDNLSESKGV